jgi:hypothetical protein
LSPGGKTDRHRRKNMKEFCVEFTIEYEGYNGYDHTNIENYTVEAKNEKSAENKARKLAKKSPYFQRGYIKSVAIKQIR